MQNSTDGCGCIPAKDRFNTVVCHSCLLPVEGWNFLDLGERVFHLDCRDLWNGPR